MCGNGIYSTSHEKVIQHKSAFLKKSLGPILRPCSRNKNSVYKSKKSSLQIVKTISVGLGIHQGEAQNTKQKKNFRQRQFLKLFFREFCPYNIFNFGSYLAN